MRPTPAFLSSASLLLLTTNTQAFPQPAKAEGRFLNDFRAQLRDTTLYPLILNPLDINKLTCGSFLTLFDNSNSDITVAADACLFGLLLGTLGVGALPLLSDEEGATDSYSA